jgi:hypothetical protein
MKMDEKTLQAVTALANKLGTTAEYLWGVLVKQAPISGALDLAVLAAWSAACVWVVRFVHGKTSGKDPAWDDEVGRVFAWVGVGLVCWLTMLIGGLSFSGSVTAIVNPEYWALRQILK